MGKRFLVLPHLRINEMQKAREIEAEIKRDKQRETETGRQKEKDRERQTAPDRQDRQTDS